MVVSTLDHGLITTGSSVTSASISPPAGALVLVFMVLPSNAYTPSVSGLGITWAHDISQKQTAHCLEVFSGIASGSTDTLSINFGGLAQSNSGAEIYEIIQITGTFTLSYTVAATKTVAGSPSTESLSLSMSSGKIVVGAWTWGDDGHTPTWGGDPDTGWSTITSQIGGGANKYAMSTQTTATVDASQDGTYTWAGGANTYVAAGAYLITDAPPSVVVQRRGFSQLGTRTGSRKAMG